jgi:hypothetical protein
MSEEQIQSLHRPGCRPDRQAVVSWHEEWLVQDSQVLCAQPCCRRIPKIPVCSFVLLVGQLASPLLDDRRGAIGSFLNSTICPAHRKTCNYSASISTVRSRRVSGLLRSFWRKPNLIDLSPFTRIHHAVAQHPRCQLFARWCICLEHGCAQPDRFHGRGIPDPRDNQGN